VSEQRSPLEQVLDLVVYAPVGLVVVAGEELPRLVEKGRAQLTGQIAMARVVGRFAVAQGQREAGKAVRQAGGLLGDLGVLPRERGAGTTGPTGGVEGQSGPTGEAPEPPDQADLAPAEDPGARDGSVVDDDGLDEDASVNPGMPEWVSASHARGKELAIPGYDALSASQVVQRLDGLSSAELEEVRAYELLTRGRRTILSKIAQLQAGSP
jgi:hypothetical protein